MDDFERRLANDLKDPEFKKAWEESEAEYQVTKAMVEARHYAKMTQKQLSKRTGIAQADISKIETGQGNPTLSVLQRIANGLDMDLSIQFVPKINT